MSRAPFVASVLAFVFSGVMALAEAPQVERLMAESNRHCAAHTSRTLSNASQSLCQCASAEELHKLKMDPRDDVAIMAAWEIVRRTVDETQETEAVAPHSGSLNRFIGFVEGRLHTNLPAWWKKDMEEARVYNRRFSFCRKLADWPECFMTESGYYAPQDTSVNRVGDDWVVSVGTEACVLPHGLMKSPDLFEVITASISAERCYVAIHEASSMPYLIYCIDRKKKEISWKTDAWVNHQRSRRRYIGFPLLAIKEHKERVFLFGITHYQAYIQCYNRDDGTRIFRFSTW